MSFSREDTLCLFDIDGTLAPAMKEASPEMLKLLGELQKKVTVGVVGGSNIEKAQKQLGADMKERFDFAFPENGLLAYEKGEEIHRMQFKLFLPQENLNRLLSFILRYIADLDIPVKRGTFIEFRTGMLNVSPIGRNCSYEERVAFNKYDAEHKVREKMVKVLEKEFADYGLRFSIGGMISFDVFPNSWDKTYCLQHVAKYNFKTIHFFGDKTKEGQNDYEIYNSPLTVGHHVDSPDDTTRILNELFFSS